MEISTLAALLGLFIAFIGMGALLGAGAVLGLIAGLLATGLLAGGVLTSSTLAGLLTRKWSTGLWLIALQAGALAGAAVGGGAVFLWQLLWVPPEPREAPWLAACLGGAGGGLLLALAVGAFCRLIAHLLQTRYGDFLTKWRPSGTPLTSRARRSAHPFRRASRFDRLSSDL